MSEPIRPEHKKYIVKIRELWVRSGGRLWHEAEEWGLNTFGRKAGEPGSIELSFDYGVPHRLCVDDGEYVVLGSCGGGDLEEFWRLLNEAYTVHIVRPKRDDAVVRRTNPVAYQTQHSGPLVALVEKA